MEEKCFLRFGGGDCSCRSIVLVVVTFKVLFTFYKADCFFSFSPLTWRTNTIRIIDFLRTRFNFNHGARVRDFRTIDNSHSAVPSIFTGSFRITEIWQRWELINQRFLLSRALSWSYDRTERIFMCFG